MKPIFQRSTSSSTTLKERLKRSESHITAGLPDSSRPDYVLHEAKCIRILLTILQPLQTTDVTYMHFQPIKHF